MYVTQVSRRRKPASKIEKLLCIFQKFPVASFILTAHCFQVCIAKMELLFSGILYFMFWAGGLAFSVKVYLNLGCLSALDNSIICVTRIPYCCCCCYPCSTFVTKVKYQHQCFAGEEQKPREQKVMHRFIMLPGLAMHSMGCSGGECGVRCGSGFTKPLQSSGWTKWAELSTEDLRFAAENVSVSKLNLSTCLRLF